MHWVNQYAITVKNLDKFPRSARSSRMWCAATVGRGDTNLPTVRRKNGDEALDVGLKMEGAAVIQVADPSRPRNEETVTIVARQDIGLQNVRIPRSNRGPASIVVDMHRNGGIIGGNQQAPWCQSLRRSSNIKRFGWMSARDCRKFANGQLKSAR